MLAESIGPIAGEAQPGRSDVRDPLPSFIRSSLGTAEPSLRLREAAFSHSALLLGAARGMGVRTKRLGAKHTLFQYRGRNVGAFDGFQTTLASHQSTRVCQSIALTRKYLQEARVATFPSRPFEARQLPEALEIFRAEGARVTVSADHQDPDSHQRLGVSSEAGFISAWTAEAGRVAVLAPRLQKLQFTAHTPSLWLRAYVVGESLVGAVVRVPLYVTGDGERTVAQLVEAELARRRQCRHLGPKQPSQAGDVPEVAALGVNSIPRKGDLYIVTNSIRGVGDGCISVDVRTQIDTGLKNLALDATWAIPGLRGAAVDILAPSLNASTDASVYSIAPWADISEFRYPSHGLNSKPHRMLIEQMIRQP